MFVKADRARTGPPHETRRGQIDQGDRRQLGVSPSSVSRWVSDITLAPGFIEALRQRDPTVNGRLSGVRAQMRRPPRSAAREPAGRTRPRSRPNPAAPRRLHALLGRGLQRAQRGQADEFRPGPAGTVRSLLAGLLRRAAGADRAERQLPPEQRTASSHEIETVVAGSPRAPGGLIAGRVGQPHVYGVSLATERPRLRDRAGERRLHSNRAKHLWRHPAVRWD